MTRSFAIVPAAGRSRRMGSPKLLLPWQGSTIIEWVLSAWQASRVDCVVVVVHPEDTQLAEVCRPLANLIVTPPTPPPEMKASVRLGLEAVRHQFAPVPEDAWLVAPADIPQLSPEVIDSLLAAHRPAEPAILVPVHAGRRGHPVLFPWPLATAVAGLPEEAGINRLLVEHAVREVPCSAVALAADVDTLQDYDAQRE